MPIDLLVILGVAIAIPLGLLLSWPIRRASQNLRIQRFSPTLVDQLGFTARRSGYGMLYTGLVADQTCTVSVHPRYNHNGPMVGNRQLYIGDNLYVSIAVPIHTRATFELSTEHSIDQHWLSQLTANPAARQAINRLLPKNTKDSAIHLIPDALRWQLHVPLADCTPETTQQQWKALDMLVKAIQKNPAPTVKDATTPAEQRWLLDLHRTRGRIKWYTFGCLGGLLLFLYGMIRLILFIEEAGR